MILILALPIIRRDSGPGPQPAEPSAGAPGTGTPPDLSTMTPRDAADRLFNRVMAAAENGNTAEVQQFMPMAIAAHEQARPLDLDGLFHLTQLHQTAQDYTAALTVAREILGQNPDYLLGLSAAAEAAKALGDTALAREHYTRFLAVYDAEMAKNLEEYSVHTFNLNATRQSAVAATQP
jgi:tetratricopeptide (TPR) repeat protein